MLEVTDDDFYLYTKRNLSDCKDSTADSKNIIIFSDGDTDACRYNDISESCPQWKRDIIRAHPQAAEARAVSKKT
ncbi:hypothetical protein OESDEN_16063 [Oesophagostomum dentatum]|uniref:Uncharacterized protein n=1 Tax=Oesophagostomum dentatum TaxID=61180 RepID=A0A0B1SK21_OESDE|nr:hypothetical protein OESDEN_16063 [Oesophagostomum dentatum]